MTAVALRLHVWRHPKPIGVVGRCIGQVDVSVDRRKIKRLAHRIRAAARQGGWAQVVHTSDLQRCRLVGRQLRAWGWQHHVDESLREMSFGSWDGQAWSDIPVSDIDAWCGNFATHAPGGGESVAVMLQRVAQRLQTWSGVKVVVAHAGWMNAVNWTLSHSAPPPEAVLWPQPASYGQAMSWCLTEGAVQYRPTTPASFK